MENILVNDIRDLRGKLLHEATKPIKDPEISVGEDKQTTNVSELKRKNKVRTLRGLLKDKITTWNMIKEAEKIEGEN